jgi:hypothetical protein
MMMVEMNIAVFVGNAGIGTNDCDDDAERGILMRSGYY